MRFQKPSKETCIHYAWHGGKALLVAIQAAIIQNAITKGVYMLSANMAEGLHVGYALLHLGVTLAAIIYMLHYYDTIDDRSYRTYGEQLAAGDESPLWRERGWQVNFLLSVLGITPTMTTSTLLVLGFLGMGRALATALAILISLVVLAGIRALQLAWRSREWAEQIAMEGVQDGQNEN